jgi:hypothetical protein
MSVRSVAARLWSALGVLVRFIVRSGKRIAVRAFGLFLLIAGLVMLVTPGPDILVIVAGLAVLETSMCGPSERFRSPDNARRAVDLAKDKARRSGNRAGDDASPVSSASESGSTRRAERKPRDAGQWIERLSGAARRSLLLAAPTSRPSITLVGDDIGSALKAGLVRERSGDRIVFMHPLYPGAVYELATPAEQRDAHLDLGQRVSDLEERARHAALAATEPDGAIAVQLDRAADRARARGAPEVAGELEERAVALTPPGDRRAAQRRALLAADYHFSAGLKADVRFVDGDLDTAKDVARAAAAREGVPFFEDGAEPAQYDGYGRIASEILDSIRPSAVVVPVGNGALLGGMGRVFGVRAPGVERIGVVARAAPVMALSFRAGRPVVCDRSATIADGLAVRVAIPLAVRELRRSADRIVEVSERELAGAVSAFASEGIRVEPAGAASLAAVRHIETTGPIVLIVTGRNVDDRLYERMISAPDSFPA